MSSTQPMRGFGVYEGVRSDGGTGGVRYANSRREGDEDGVDLTYIMYIYHDIHMYIWVHGKERYKLTVA